MEGATLKTRVVRSARRRKTVSARIEGDTLVVQVPARLSEAEISRWVERMRARLQTRGRRRELNSSSDLQRRAERLNRLYFGGTLVYESIVFVTNQATRYGSCTPGSRRIRISDQLTRMPAFVLDYVIVHELAHLLEANHGKRFWRLVHRYPHAERAIGFLMGVGLVPAQERLVEQPSLFVPADELSGLAAVGAFEQA